ncbi:MAG: MORN repeat-containing protein [Thermonemataceae bacterium]
MKKLNKQKLFWVSAALNVLLIIGLSIVLLARKSTHASHLDNAYQAKYSEHISQASYFLLNKDYDKAVQWYQRADKLKANRFQWTAMAKDFIQSQRLMKGNVDSLQYILNVLDSGSVMKEEAIGELQEELEEQEMKIDTLNDKLDETTIALNNTVLTNLELKSKLMEVGNSYKVLDFYNEEHKNVRYYGEVKNGQANGFGVGIFKSGGIYEGNWRNNIRHGKGKYTWENEDVYEGEYTNGKREGYGTYIFANQVKYEGEWKNDLRHGKGKMYSQEGKILLNGNWIDDKFQKEKHKKKVK